MRALDRDIRKQLERAVRAARIAAEEGATRKLTELGVFDARAPQHLSNDERSLRVRLRTHARALGDAQKPDDTIVGASLIREVAYEHWHRALFARFLAENAILIEPEHGVPVTLGELEEIAREDGKEPFELAAEWAAPMLPAIFRADDPALAVRLPMESRSELRALVAQLPSAVFYADDSLGWAYQFWQADQKERVNEAAKGGAKIGAEELPAVTQLFTEDYMVLFLLENTLGAWWAGKILAANLELAANAPSEEALRAATSPPGWSWSFLRFVRAQGEGDQKGRWRLAAGTFENWPRHAAEITMLDPCMGSGHFLVFALPILTAMRRAEEDLSEADALLAVLKDNLFGLEIDPRCTQIAAFALALAAWKRLGGWSELPTFNLACSGLTIGMTKAEWLGLADRMTDAWGSEQDLLGAQRPPLGEAAVARIREGLGRLYDLFRHAPVLGSLIDPGKAGGDIFSSDLSSLHEPIARALQQTHAAPEVNEAVVIAAGLEKAMSLLTRPFTLIATNVPFLGRGKMTDVLRDYCDENHLGASGDLCAAFTDRAFNWLSKAGTAAIVSSSNWWFIKSYTKLRTHLLDDARIDALIDLGPAAFDDMNWWAAQTGLSVFSKCPPGSTLLGLDCATGKGSLTKRINCINATVTSVSVAPMRAGPDARFVIRQLGDGALLSTRAGVFVGLQNGDTPRFVQFFWEHPGFCDKWVPFQLTVETGEPYSGREGALLWEGGSGSMSRSAGFFLKGKEAWGKRGIILRQMNTAAGVYTGEIYDQSSSVIIPNDANDLAALWHFLTSTEYRMALRAIDPNASVTNATFLKVPFDAEHWANRAMELGAIPAPSDESPRQWVFSGTPTERTGSQTLQTAVARALGYRWPRQTGASFLDSPAIAAPDAIALSDHVDKDGIVCLASLYGEPPAVERIRGVLTVAFGEGLDVASLLQAHGAKSHDLESWLRHEFAESHAKFFHQRPFIWQIWDGLNDGFSALLNYHRLCGRDGEGRRLLEKLRDTYLGEWIAQQKRRFEAEEAGAEPRLLAARHLSDQLTKIIEGEPPYDIFVRWKPLSEQPIGWAPDIDDGVRINVRPFATGVTKNGRSILRYRPTGLKWNKDRGSEPERPREDYPWFWADEEDVSHVDFMGGERFKGLRFNDFHYTRAAKETARRKSTAA